MLNVCGYDFFVVSDADKAVQHVTPFSFPWPLGSQFSMMGLSELKAAISLENDSVASNERQRMIKWTVDDVMSHVRALGCTEQAKIFGDQVHFLIAITVYCHCTFTACILRRIFRGLSVYPTVILHC